MIDSKNSSLISPGYKQTEVGVIPVDWKVMPLIDICNGNMQNGVFFEPSRKGKGVKMINVSDLYKPMPIASKSLELFDANEAEKTNYQVTEGDLFYTRSSVVASGIAQCNIYMKTGDECVVFDSHVIRARPDRKTNIPLYVYWSSIGSTSRRYLISVAKTGTMTTIDQQLLGGCPIALPPTLAEQQAIAEALSDVDELIGSLEKLIAKKRAIKTGAMQQLLTGKQRLPGFKREWETKRLGELVQLDPENLSSKTSLEYEFKYISLEDVSKGVLTNHSEQVFCISPSRARRIIRKGDVLVSTVRPNLQSHLLFKKMDADWICSTGFSVLRCNPKESVPEYVFFHLFAHPIEHQIIALIAGSNYPAINSGDVKKLSIPVPPTLAEQQAIAAVLSDMDAEIRALDAKLDKTKAIKQGMMSELLTGKTRLVTHLNG